jgi:hypothetical protein
MRDSFLGISLTTVDKLFITPRSNIGGRNIATRVAFRRPDVIGVVAQK